MQSSVFRVSCFVFRVRIAVGLAAVGAVVSLAGAQEKPATPPVRLPEIVITGTRLPEETVPLERFPANTTVITREEIAASPALTVPDLLQMKAGVVSFDTTGFGQDTRIGLRGYGEKPSALVLVDGVRVNHAGSGQLLGNLIAPGDIERIEIIRGGGSTTYGEGAIAGVINIITRQGAAKPFSATLGASAGSFGFYSARADVSGTTNRFSYYFSAERKEWEGWRDFSGFRSWNAVVKPSLETPAGRFTFNYRYHDEFNELPGSLHTNQVNNPRQSIASRQSTFDVQTHQLALDWFKAWGDSASVAARVHGQTYDAVGNYGGGGFLATNTQPNLGAAFQQTFKGRLFGRENTLTLGQEALLQDYRLNDNFGGVSVVDAWTVGAFVQDSLAITEKLSLTAGTRFDYRQWDVVAFSPGAFGYNLTQDKRADVWSPRVALNYTLAEKTEAWLSLSRAYRLPSGDDISSLSFATGAATLYYPNPNVAPVDARTIELGVRTSRHALLGGSVAGYFSKVKNDLLYDPVNFTNFNHDSEKFGVELELNSRPHELIELFVNSAYTDSRLTGGSFDGKRVPLVPAWQLGGGVILHPATGLDWCVEVIHADRQQAVNDLNNIFPTTGYTVANTKLTFRWREHTLFAAVNNFTDARYEQFPTSGGYTGTPFRAHFPSPGISFQAGLTAKF